jgi:hypothetical protein
MRPGAVVPPGKLGPEGPFGQRGADVGERTWLFVP